MKEDVLEVLCERAEAAMDEIEKAARRQGSGPVRQGAARGGRRRPAARRPTSARLLDRAGHRVERIEKIVPSLEDVFVSLIEARDRAEQPQAGGAAMNLRRVWAVARKEFLHVLRDSRSLVMAIAMPMLLLVLFGYALTLDVDNVPLVVWDQSGTARAGSSSAASPARAISRSACTSTTTRDLERAIDTRRGDDGRWSCPATSPSGSTPAATPPCS